VLQRFGDLRVLQTPAVYDVARGAAISTPPIAF
jgi:hypothetical protein